MTIRVVIADDHPIIVDGLSQLLAAAPDCEVVARCSNGAEALQAVRRLTPDVLVLDVRMPGGSGLDALREIHRDQLPAKVVLLTAELSDDETIDAVRHGVRGIVLKASATRQLLECVRTVAGGGEYIDESSVRGALDGMLRREAGAAEVRRVLTPREIEIVRMVASGLRNRQIADQLSISEATVKIHVHSIYQKLGISGRVELSNWAREKALV